MESFAQPIHLLLTDVVMPQMSGKALAGHMAALHPETRVLYMSGYTDEAIVRHGVLEGSTFFLQKPFTSGALVRRSAKYWTLTAKGSVSRVWIERDPTRHQSG